MDFGDAIKAMKEGKAVHRTIWMGTQARIKMQMPDEYSKMSIAYLYIENEQGVRVPWSPSQLDMLQEDWSVVE